MNHHHENTHIDLFSGVGGFSLAAEACGLRTLVFVERDTDRQRDLTHHWPGVPIIADVNDADAIERAVVADTIGEPIRGRPGNDAGETGAVSGDGGQRERIRADNSDGNESPYLLTAGVPCQPASSAGKRQGSGDDRWLWPQTLRVVERLRPRWCVFENPLGLASLALPAALPDVDLERLRGVPGRTIAEIIRRLDLLGYDLPRDRDGVAWIPVVPAVGVGAFHGRDRLWIVARRRDVEHAVLRDGSPEQREQQAQASGSAESGASALMDNADRAGQQQRCEMHAGSGELGGGQRTDSTARGSGRCLPDWRGAILETGADGITRPTLPGLRLLAHGLPRRTSKLRGFGNAVVPAVAQEIIRSIVES